MRGLVRRLRSTLRSVFRRRGASEPIRELVLEIAAPQDGVHRTVRTIRRLRVRTPARLYIPKRLEEAGLAGYEPETMSCFMAALDVLPRGAVFDVGANVGVFALLAASLSNWTVVAFEPTPELAKVARSLVELNGLTCRVEEVALGAVPGTATLYLSNVTDSSNSLRAGFRPSARSVAVTVRTLDDYCASSGVLPTLLKIDTESTEPDVLRGASGVLSEARPWIICEVLAGRTEAELTSLLEPLGYSWYHMTDAKPRPRAKIIGDPTYRHMNWLFSPVPPSQSFWSARARWLKALRA